jgi:hypothetical protein
MATKIGGAIAGSPDEATSAALIAGVGFNDLHWCENRCLG